MSDRLFDPPGPKVTVAERALERKRDNARCETATPVAVTLGAMWRLIQRAKKAEVHAYKDRHLIKTGPTTWMDGGSIKTVCGVVGIPLTFDPGQVAPACPACLAAGATP